MKNIIVYYLAIVIPALAIFWWMKTADEPYWPVIFLFVYFLVYRPFTDGLRLKQKGVISKNEFIKQFIPFYFFNHENWINWFKELFFRA